MKAKQQILIVGGALLFVLICFVVSIWWSLYGRFAPAESTMRTELAALNLPAEFQQESIEFRPGSCLDNCPALGATYKVSGTREQIGQILKLSIMARGYTVEYHAGEVWSRQKGHVEITTESLPELGTGTRDYIFDFLQQSQQVTQVEISLRYL